MDSPKFLSPIRPTWVEMIDGPSFISQAQLQQLFSNIGTIIRIPYLSQCISFASVQGCKCNSSEQRDYDPIPLKPPGPTDIAIAEFELQNKGPMAVRDSLSSTDATWKEQDSVQPLNFVQLLRQQTIGAQEVGRGTTDG
ncbi:hypothetical protein R1sor_001754 [Riccia sorocarpa]|uniref:RRM domain-containing protein n=1 Tax=Riccia sorocarpa TaxID=122646 RepID=A0ABD3GWU0_9MARC